MPSLSVDAPCSLLVLSCWLESARLVEQEGEEASKPPACGQLPASCAHHRPTAPSLWPAPHHFGENEGVAHEV